MVDELGVATGEGIGEPFGVRRGEGKGNSWSSSSSSFKAVLLMALSNPLVEIWSFWRVREGKSPASELPLSFFSMASSRLMTSVAEAVVSSGESDSRVRRRLSTSSTFRTDSKPGMSWFTRRWTGRKSSALELRLLLAPLENFSCQALPSRRHSSATGKHFRQQSRRGTVTTSSLGAGGSEGRRRLA